MNPGTIALIAVGSVAGVLLMAGIEKFSSSDTSTPLGAKYMYSETFDPSRRSSEYYSAEEGGGRKTKRKNKTKRKK